MQIEVSDRLTIIDPTLEVQRWCKENLILDNPEFINKLRMGFWLGDTPERLYLFERNGKNLIIPYGCLRSILSLVPDCTVKNSFAKPELVDFNCTVPLYDYQQKAMTAMMNAYYGILQSPAGSGKTQIGIALAVNLKCKTLWLTHTLDLVKQSRERAELYMDKNLLGEITRGKVSIGKGITFATVQTMCNLDLGKYQNEWDCIIVDECHRVSGTPTSTTRFYKVLSNLKARHKYGLSATVHRSDGMIQATYALLGNIVYTVPENEVTDRIMKVGICPQGTDVGIDRKILNTDGTLNYSKMINYLCGHDDRNRTITNWIIRNKNHSCLILSDRLEHLKNLMNRLPPDMQREAVMVSGSMTSATSKVERDKAITDMRSGEKKYLFASYALAKEGLDIPCLDRLFLTTPHKDYAVVTQSIGRIARTCPGKEEAIAYDFVDDGIPYLIKAYKTRCYHYRKNQCYFVRTED